MSIISHINRSCGASFAYLRDYDVYLAKRVVRRILGDRVARPQKHRSLLRSSCIKKKKKKKVLLQLFRLFDLGNHLHGRMRALFLVAFFSILRISNLVPYSCPTLAIPRHVF